jgi:hypothetical protein
LFSVSKNSIELSVEDKEQIYKGVNSSFLSEGGFAMSKKGETGEQDRGKPKPRKKKEREDARKKKKLDRVERQKSR